MRIGAIGGEFALIERLAARLPGGPAVAVNIGDDAAVLAAQTNPVLVTTDLLIDGVHFRRTWGVPPSRLGVKALAVNLSDIAAMGGTPTATFVSLALPADTDVAFVDGLYQGLSATGQKYGTVIAGGDTNVTPGPLVISITQLGVQGDAGPLLRSGARPGDVILVTGTLGASAAGLALLEKFGYREANARVADAVTAHLEPVPRLAAGRRRPARAA